MQGHTVLRTATGLLGLVRRPKPSSPGLNPRLFRGQRLCCYHEATFGNLSLALFEIFSCQLRDAAYLKAGFLLEEKPPRDAVETGPLLADPLGAGVMKEMWGSQHGYGQGGSDLMLQS